MGGSAGVGTATHDLTFKNSTINPNNQGPLIRSFKTTILVAILVGVGSVGRCSEFPARTIPLPLPGHPGNVFLAGEEVVVTLPQDWAGPWCVTDYDGHTTAQGTAAGKIALGKLPVGYYEIPRGEGKPPIGIAVLTPLMAPTPLTSPIATDSSVPWFLGNHLPEAANLCALAGVNWDRARLKWTEMEPKPGEFAPAGRYDAAVRENHNAGLQTLQVNCFTPPWAGSAPNRFPADLRTAYRFYREMASRWQGQVQAFEPWNEADWLLFGGHTGAEMASFQKACYWGLKAGNPDVIVGQNVFANYFPEVIADFHDNQAWPYFDTFNFHHYWAMAELPGYYASFRAISGGRPLWVTECNFEPGVGDGVAPEPKTSEFSMDGLRRQAAQVLQGFAISIQGGSVATFWFILPNFPNGSNQFGSLRSDLTPRPSYLALAAAGRLLADAVPVGRIKSAHKDFWGFLFRAKPDGREQLVLVGWTMKGTERIKLPAAPKTVFDTIGREQQPAGDTLEVTAAPVIATFPLGLQRQFDYEPAPARPPWVAGKPSPVVLQAVWPAEMSKAAVPAESSSQYMIASDAPERIPIYAYNFGPQEVRGRLTVTGPKDWNLAIQHEVTLKPMERMELPLTCNLSRTSRRTRAAVRIEGDFGPAGKSLLSIRLLPLLPATPKFVCEVPALLDAGRWQSSPTGNARVAVSAVPDGVLVECDRGQSGLKEFQVAFTLEPAERPSKTNNALMLPVTILEGVASLSVRLAEATTNSLSVPVAYGMGARAKKDDGAISFGAAVTPCTLAEPQRTLDPGRLHTIRIDVGDLKGQKLRFLIQKSGWATF